MRKKNVRSNKQVIKALSIGLSAAMLMQPVAAMAEELPDAVEPVKAEKLEAAQTSVAIDENVDKTLTDVKDALADVDEKIEDAFALVEEISTADGVDAVTVADVNEALKEAGQNEVKEAEDNIADAEMNITVATVAENKAEDAVKKAEDLSTSANDVATEIETIVNEAEKKIGESVAKIDDAVSIQAANEAYDEVVETFNEAKEDYDEKIEEYNDVKAQYEEALEAKKVAEEVYGKALEDGTANVKEAGKELSDAKENLEALKAELEKAQKEALESVGGALEILAKQEAVKDNKSVDWAKEDELFASIIKNYVEPGSTVTRVKGVDNDSFNYFVVKNDGITKYYDYKMDGSSNSNIVIYEVSEDEVKADAYLKANKLAVQDVYKYTEDGETKYIAASELTEIDGNLYLLSADGEKQTLIDTTSKVTSKSQVAINETATEYEVVDGTEHEVFEIVDGQIIKYTVADLTETEFKHLQTAAKDYIKGGYSDSVKGSDKATVEAQNGVSEAEITNLESADTFYVVKGQYRAVYRVNFSGKTIEEYEDGENAAKQALIKRLQNAGFTVINYDLSASRKSDWFNVGKEEYYVTGSIDYTNKANNTVVVTSDEKTSAAAAEANAKAKINLSADGKNGSATIETVKEVHTWHWIDYKDVVLNPTETYDSWKVTETESYKKLSYLIDYLMSSTSTVENEQIAKQQYNSVDKTKVDIDKNFKAGNIELDENDNVAFKLFLSKALDIKNKYANLVAEVEAAKDAVEKAKSNVESLQEELDNLKKENVTDKHNEKIAKLEVLIGASQIKVGEAEKKLNDLQEKVNGSEAKLEASIRRLTPVAPSNETPAARPAEQPVVQLVAPVSPVAPVRAVAVVAPMEETEEIEVVELFEEETPLAAEIEETEEVAEEEKAEVVIEEDETPLAPTMEETQKMSWWWLLIVLVLGASGAELYRRHQLKKKADEATK